MALFGKKEDKKAPACACNAGCPTSEVTQITSDCCSEVKEGICCIKVLGAGCKSCHEQYENAKEAVKSMGLSVEVEYITDMQKVMECACPKKTCPNNGKCCACVIKHRETDSLPYCLFPDNNGDKSNKNHYEVLKKRFKT